ncbi:MAG TPA: RNA polymerase sigma factor [Actinomycetota bacterium]|nr:RNA polymerase sigma factor [Actinomycetota bacterium]
MERTLEELAEGAARGDRAALDALVRRIQDDVYRLALRMLGHPADAEDAAQEILVKVVTHLGSFRGESSFRTWVWRIAANHVASVRRSRREVPGLSFEALEDMLRRGLAAAGEPDAVDPVLEEEVKLGCTGTMLLCLDRDHRLAFVLSEIFDLTSREGAEVLGISPAAFRKRLERARERLRTFMSANCGLVSEEASCRCRRQVGPSVAAGLIDPEHLLFALHPTRARADPAARRALDAIEGARRYAAVLRGHPAYAAPPSVLEGFRELLAEA